MGEKVENKLENDFKYYVEHQAELVKKYTGKFIVIKNCEVIGVYDSQIIALKETTKIHALGTFLVKECKPGTESYTQTYHSRVLAA